MNYICYACTNEGPGRRVKRGSGKAELWIYLLFMVPGPLYTIWRRVALKRTCTYCGMQAVVKVTSDQGQIAKRRLDMELGIVPLKKREEAVSVPVVVAEPLVEKMITKKPAKPEEW